MFGKWLVESWLIHPDPNKSVNRCKYEPTRGSNGRYIKAVKYVFYLRMCIPICITYTYTFKLQVSLLQKKGKFQRTPTGQPDMGEVLWPCEPWTLAAPWVPCTPCRRGGLSGMIFLCLFVSLREPSLRGYEIRICNMFLGIQGKHIEIIRHPPNIMKHKIPLHSSFFGVPSYALPSCYQLLHGFPLPWIIP